MVPWEVEVAKAICIQLEYQASTFRPLCEVLRVQYKMDLKNFQVKAILEILLKSDQIEKRGTKYHYVGSALESNLYGRGLDKVETCGACQLGIGKHTHEVETADTTYIDLKQALTTCDGYFCPSCNRTHDNGASIKFLPHLDILVAGYASSDVAIYGKRKDFKESGRLDAALAAIAAGKKVVR